MMKVVTTKGEIREVNSVIPFAEVKVKLNGDKRYLCEKAEKKEYANGLLLSYENRNGFCGGGLDLGDFLVGNLGNDKVQEILSSLTEKGYYDFSDMEFQKKKALKKVKIDGGKSLPYSSDQIGLDFTQINSIRCHMIGNDIFDEDDFDEDDFDEDTEGDGLDE